jgi:hypothetical protein
MTLAPSKRRPSRETAPADLEETEPGGDLDETTVDDETLDEAATDEAAEKDE